MAGVNIRFAVVTKDEILQMLIFLECFELSPSLYLLLQLFSSISVNSGFKNTHFKFHRNAFGCPQSQDQLGSSVIIYMN